MTDERRSEVLGALPHRRPHRRSEKRGVRPAAMREETGAHKPQRLRQPAQPAGTPPSPPSRGTVPTTGADILGTAVHAAAELAEIGLSASARALRNAVARLPRP
jgi:hypothetical protein